MSVTTTSGLRCLIACTECKRQFDASGFAAKSRFHCACGQILEVPRFDDHHAEVVRCSSCSAPRGKGTLSCEHCGADFTLHEQDMHTICPACMTRVSDKARYCHHCATPIVAAGDPGKPTRKGCPACGRRHKLTGRAMGEPAVPVLECPRCAGLWLSAEAFGVTADSARMQVQADSGTDRGRRATAARGPVAGPAEPLYRRCPECMKFMHRRNYGKKSGVLIDSCKTHGMWFDARELATILAWIRDGGETRAAEREASEARQKLRKARLRLDRESRCSGSAGWEIGSSGSETGLDVIGGILGRLFDL